MAVKPAVEEAVAANATQANDDVAPAAKRARMRHTGKTPLERKEAALKLAVDRGLISATKPLALFIDEDDIRESVDTLMTALPPAEGWMHCFAVKANNTLDFMKLLASHGMGLEFASLGEMTQGLRALGVPDTSFPDYFGFPNGGTTPFVDWPSVTAAKYGEKAGVDTPIVFDSPVKTTQEIHFALEHGIPVNVDNWEELARVDDWVKKNGPPSQLPGHRLYGRVGIRINPQCGAGAIASHSTGTKTSKFGIGLEDSRRELLEAYVKRPWLRMAHCHVGSQGIPLDLMMTGIKALVGFVKEVHAATGGRGKSHLDVINIGGGLGVNFKSEDVTPTFADYGALLREHVPELFGFDRIVPAILTEMGRTLSSKSGWIGTRLEYAKRSGDRKIVSQHAGVDLCIRTIYHPEAWPLRVTCFDPKGEPMRFDPSSSSGDLEETDVAGPCCIGGDIIAHKRPLPKALAAGDILMVHDVGGYYIASYSKYNSRQAPPVHGYWTEAGGKDVAFRVLQKGESVADTLRSFDSV